MQAQTSLRSLQEQRIEDVYNELKMYTRLTVYTDLLKDIHRQLGDSAPIDIDNISRKEYARMIPYRLKSSRYH